MNKNLQSGYFLLLIGFLLICFTGMYYQDEADLGKEDFLRFHVVANSNSAEDQALKLKVRDAVLEEVSPALAKMDTAEDSRAWVEAHTSRINEIAVETIEKEGYDYSAASGIGMRWIPEKSYGSVTMPAGNYEAFTIEIGAGQGENWWCVMFPPLCVVGDTENLSEEELLAQFQGTRYGKMIESEIEGTPYVLKFKTVEIGKKFKNMIKN